MKDKLFLGNDEDQHVYFGTENAIITNPNDIGNKLEDKRWQK